MLFLHDGELIHADRGSDILEHYGVKGMRWGARRALNKMEKYKFKQKKYKEIANSRRRALKGKSQDMTRARIKRAVVGQLLAGPVAAAVGAGTVSRNNLQKSANRFDRKADNMDLKIREQKYRLKSMGVK